jgi:glycosyltransferase involved in cell wall biosynthesis
MKLNLLSISLDESLLTCPRGDVLERQLEYSQYFNEITIIIPTSKKLKPKTIKSLKIIPTNSKNKFHFVINLVKLSKTYQFDLITAQDPFITGIAGVILKLQTKKPLNIQCHTNYFHHSFYFKNLKNFLLFLTSFLTLPFANSIRVVSKQIKTIFRSKTYTAPIPANLKIFENLKPVLKKNQIITVARLEKEKNLNSLIKAFAKVHQKYQAYKLLIIGSGSQEKALKKLVSKLGLKDSIIFKGQLPQKQIAKYLIESRMFCLPSLYEGYGLSLLEALAVGLPVISTKVGIAPEVINLTNGILIKKDFGSIQKAMLRLINSPIIPPRFSLTQPTIKQISRMLTKHTL